MNIVIFSKNRASQLDLLLRTFKENFKEFDEHNIKILYKATDANYKQAYEKINYLNVKLIEESNFKQDLIQLIDKSDELTMFLVDDIIFKESFSLEDKQFEIFKSSNDILALSLRLHPNLNYCYAAGFPLSKPNLLEYNIINWTRENPGGDYGYPMSLDGNIFKTKDIYNTLRLIQYTNPNSLEATLADIANHPNSTFRDKPKMIMYEKSALFNNPINKVQTNNPNKHGNIDAEFLNKKFLNGERIINNFKGLENISCHQEIEIQFEK